MLFNVVQAQNEITHGKVVASSISPCMTPRRRHCRGTVVVDQERIKFSFNSILLSALIQEHHQITYREDAELQEQQRKPGEAQLRSTAAPAA
jgi:hypothetical protein